MAGRKEKGYAPWSPRAKAQLIVDQVNAMIGAGGELETVLPVTIRQIYYRLIAMYDYPKTDAFAENLGSYLTKARRARMIPFEAIHDQGIIHAEARYNVDPDERIEVARSLLRGHGYRLDHQLHQYKRLVIWCEAAGLVRQVEAVARGYGIDTISGGGQPSVTFNWQLAQRLKKLCDDGNNKIAEVLMLGDFDPAGLVITSTGGRDIIAFAEADYGLRVRVARIALNEDQVIERKIQTAPMKQEDKRFYSEFGHPWPGVGDDPAAIAQLEAIPPLELQALVRDEIEMRLDPDMVARVKEREADDVKVIQAKGKALDYRRLGRPPVPNGTTAHICVLRAEGLSVRAIAAKTGVAKSTVARLLQKVSPG